MGFEFPAAKIPSEDPAVIAYFFQFNPIGTRQRQGSKDHGYGGGGIALRGRYRAARRLGGLGSKNRKRLSSIKIIYIQVHLFQSRLAGLHGAIPFPYNHLTLPTK